MTDITMRPLGQTFETNVVGVTFIDGYPANVLALSTTDDLWLVRQPDNEYDSNAIAVHAWPLGPIGHIGREVAARMAPEIDAGTEWKAELVEVAVNSKYPNSPGVHIRCTRTVQEADNG